MARPRKSEKQARKDGTYNSTKQKGRSTKLAACPPIAPDWLAEDAKVIFEETVSFLESAEILSLADASLVAHYAVLEAAFRRDPDGFVAAKHSQLRLLRAEVGMTPQGRLKIDSDGPKKDDPAEDYFH